jgi:TonB family protein
VSRRDWVIRCAARAVCALYWFHPLAWLALRLLELEAERACDDAVLEHSEATAYADQLVAAARRISTAAQPPLLAMAARADLASRVRAVLDGGRRRGRAGVWTVAGVAAVSAALAIAMAPLRLVAAPQDRGGAPVARLRTDIRLVLIPTKVTYPNGEPVQGLTATDFEITEDGGVQALRFCEFHKAVAADPDSGFYLLGYYPRNHGADGQFRKISVVVKTATTAKVRHRPGYFVNQRVGLALSNVAPRPAAPGVAPPYDRAPVLTFKKEPEYSEAAREAKYQGAVLLDIDVDLSGRPVNVHVARSLGLGLDEQAVEAVRLWRFRPASKDGKPVEAKAQVEVIFRLL